MKTNAGVKTRAGSPSRVCPCGCGTTIKEVREYAETLCTNAVPPSNTTSPWDQPEVLPPSPDIRAFLRRLGQLHVDAKKIEWGGEDLARINACALCEMIAGEIGGG